MNGVKNMSPDKKEIIEKIARNLSNHDNVVFAYIFGSFVSCPHYNDIDVAVFISDLNGISPLILEFDLDAALEDSVSAPVDVRIINNAPVSFAYNIIKNMVVVVDKQESVRSDFEGQTFKEYFDLRHLRREYLRDVIHAPV